MKQKFFTNTIQSKFIKNLLATTALPLYNSVRDGDYVVNNINYIYERSLIKCIKSGILGETAETETIKNDFIVGRDYVKNTQIISSSSNFYDSETHRYLGDYLRFFRDVFKINLMPFYNCFTGVYTSRFYIDINNQVNQLRYDYYQQGSTEFNTRYNKKENFKVLQVPIKFNKTYTIAIDCIANISMVPCFIANNQLLSVIQSGDKINLTNKYKETYNNSYNFSSLQFNNPITVKFENNNSSPLDDSDLSLDTFFQRYEKYLYLLIQLPESNESSIVVLEGDYTDIKSTKIFNIEAISGIKVKYKVDETTTDTVEYRIDDSILNKVCSSGLSLLTLNDKTRYPFADRLIEYLLWNVIDYTDDIGDNVSRIQHRLSINLDQHVRGYYDEYLRAKVFTTFRDSNKYTNLDSNGFVDKDVESFLFK